jgi:serine/threonine-protein kinase
LTTLANGEVTHRYPQILPGAKAVLFTAASSIGNFDTANIQVFSLKTGKTKTLVTAGYFGRYVPSNGRRGHILYVSQDRLFAIPFDPERLEILGTAQIVVEGISNRQYQRCWTVRFVEPAFAFRKVRLPGGRHR